MNIGRQRHLSIGGKVRVQAPFETHDPARTVRVGQDECEKIVGENDFRAFADLFSPDQAFPFGVGPFPQQEKLNFSTGFFFFRKFAPEGLSSGFGREGRRDSGNRRCRENGDARRGQFSGYKRKGGSCRAVRSASARCVPAAAGN